MQNTVKTTTITLAQLVAKLASITHAMPIAFSALTDPKARKTGNPFAEIRKLSTVRAFTGFDYENSVNRQQVREGATQGQFEAQARSWGERISPALVTNKGQFYLIAKVESARKPVFLAKRSPGDFLAVISKEAIAAFLPDDKARIAATAESQGTEKAVVYRNYSLGNLVSVSLNGERFRIRH